MQSITKINLQLLQPTQASICALLSAKLHISIPDFAWSNDRKPTHFTNFNKKIYPPQTDEEERRPAFVCHQKTNIRYSPKKMWYVAHFIRGMPIDEAIKQLNFVIKKGAQPVKETLLEAQELAVTKHNVEFKSNLWVAESFATKGMLIKGMRRHAKGRMGEIRYLYCHYFVKLEEGVPPKNYHNRFEKTPQEMLSEWLEGMRGRKVVSSL